ncbi:MAG: RNA 2',3'-cyclic phosphodiesterase [Pelolinea sp.]|nr:RNA 2',3'-cyclic phosphodiesterase [Pelolinea sp.]
MPSKTIRTFFAIKLPLQRLEQVERGLMALKRSIPDHIKWVPVDLMHITLKFIGFFNPDHLIKIQEDLEKQLKGFGQINFTIEKPGVFPTKRNPKTVWLGLNKIDRICELENIINLSSNKLGYRQEKRKFSPHLTIGRLRNSVPQEVRPRIGQNIINYEFPIIDPVIINELSFIRSDLTQQGPIYTMLYEIRL